jgi:hypothetical protein
VGSPSAFLLSHDQFVNYEIVSFVPLVVAMVNVMVRAPVVGQRKPPAIFLAPLSGLLSVLEPGTVDSFASVPFVV